MSDVTNGLDHVILSVADLDRAVALVGESLGLHVSGGGVHPSRGTMNRIIVIGSAYVELIVAQPGAIPSGFIGSMVLKGGTGWVGFALSMADPAETATYLSGKGFSVEGPSDGRLDTGDEFSRSWQTVRLSGAGDAGAPFLIRHQTDGDERRRLLAGTVGLREHSLGARSISRITVACENNSSFDFYERYLDLAAAERSQDSMLQADTSTYTLADGTELMLAVPLEAGRGPVAERLRATGPGLMAVTIAVAALPDAVRDLRGRGIGVRVEEPNGVLVAAQLQHRQTLDARFALVQAQRA